MKDVERIEDENRTEVPIFHHVKLFPHAKVIVLKSFTYNNVSVCNGDTGIVDSCHDQYVRVRLDHDANFVDVEYKAF